MKSSIFRKEALLFAQQGRVKPFYTPLATNYLVVTLCFCAIAIAATAWLINQHYVRYQTVTGWIEPEVGVAVHRAPIRGRIIEQLTKVGDRVEKGDVLLLVSPLQFMPNGASIVNAQQEVLAIQQQALVEQQRQAKTLDEQKRAMLKTQLAGAKQKQTLLQQAVADRHKILSFAQAQYDRAGKLFRQGHIAEASLLDLSEKIQHLKLQGIDLQADVAGIEAQIGELTQQLTAQGIQASITQNQYRQKLYDLEQRQLGTQSSGHHAVVASQSGIVDSLPFHTGDEVNIGQALVNILPEGAELIGIMRVPVQAAGFLQRGQTVELRYSAYPYQKYGIHHGEISQLNETPDADSEGHFFYTARVALASSSVLAHGKYYPLKTGMGFEADVVLSRRSFAEWLFEPLYSLRGVATR